MHASFSLSCTEYFSEISILIEYDYLTEKSLFEVSNKQLTNDNEQMKRLVTEKEFE